MQTVCAELRRLFREGTRPDSASGLTGDLSPLPFLPVQVFAASAHLLEASGAYQYVVAPYSPCIPGASRYEYPGPTFSPAEAELRAWIGIGRDWSSDPRIRDAVQPYWDALLACGGDKLVLTPGAGVELPAWWSPCHALLVIADEASGDFGYDFQPSPRPASAKPAKWANVIAGLVLENSTERRAIANARDPADLRHLSRHVALDSLGAAIDRHVARVLPKGRTTEIGCTLRTFSHNLTLLPPHGRANAYWHQPGGISNVPDRDVLNLMIVPFPYVIPPATFHGSECVPNPSGGRWGRFQVDQRWLRPDESTVIDHDVEWSTEGARADILAFLDELLEEAGRRGAGPIHGIVLPELAVDWETYDAVVRHVRDTWPNIEFVVSGVSKDCNGRHGNQVTSSVLHTRSDGIRVAETHSRRKHHRWQVDRGQIEAYGMQAELDPDVVWWEHLSVEERVLHIDVLREGSTMTAVICEDLARVDPGLSLLRSLGPSLVFALLMDGPQRTFRWPGTYATALTDDPGSSVLSLTCAGMVDRSNTTWAARNPGSPTRRTIALWKNRPGPASHHPPGDFVEIDMPDGHQGVVLSLAGTRAHETTMDGRPNSDTTAWYLRGSQPVGIAPATLDGRGLRWITGPP